MIDIEKTLQSYQASLCKEIDLASLLSRSNIAHKWQVTFRLMVIREAVAYRVVDILTQAFNLGNQKMIVGAHILTRSALESLCLLIYSNSRMKLVVDNKMDFFEFDNITTSLLMGANNVQKLPAPVNVVALIKEGNSKYPGIATVYDDLCEIAHPNYAGIHGYIRYNNKEFEAHFGNFWEKQYNSQHDESIRRIIKIFEKEYNIESAKYFEALEKWLERNDSKLERKRNKKMK
jgi:hypothetical protein